MDLYLHFPSMPSWLVQGQLYFIVICCTMCVFYTTLTVLRAGQLGIRGSVPGRG